MSDEIHHVLRRSVPALMAAADALPHRDELGNELACVDGAAKRGYFFPDEEERVRLRYTQYLALRTAMVETLDELQADLGTAVVEWSLWRNRLPVFAVAFAASCILDRADRYLVELAAERSVVWKKLDEEDRRAGIPRKTFTRIYREHSHPRTMTRLVLAAEFYRKHREQIHSLAEDSVFGPVIVLLRKEEPWMDARVGAALKRRASYRWFSFLRRHRSAWKQVTFGIFEASGRAVADLRVPGVKRRGEAKRIGAAQREELLSILRPGDVLVTRHDDALSNWFLPGFWPHAALFLGELKDPEALAADQKSGSIQGPCFIEAKKDGVRVRPVEETLQVDALLVLRPPLGPEAISRALDRVIVHAGKPYDFLFDFRTADRMVCTEVVYRGYHGIEPLKFQLKEVGGRLCLPAEEFLTQAFGCGFQLIATAGLAGNQVLIGEAAQRAFERGTAVAESHL